MIQENGKVVDVNSQGVWVETVKQSACASCAAKNGCGQKLLASVGQGKRFIFRVNNPDNLSVITDDDVLIGIEEGAFLKATVFMYLMPLIGLFAGAVIADALGFSEGWMILISFSSLLVGFLLVRFGSYSLFRSCKYQPTLMKVI
ncbi:MULTISPECIES: SoxR reducing system RseC family protein [unclassified Neptuniibacter]|jgi:sigma-E factor negative regulatory protein RseC|uniref:SoxR reducing system RseC family protein n=1 Tax=unclassified Neptuniibacter TaxID=2630693 RepID=UPI0026E37D61|nr:MULTISPECIES: SoxR reducing system RseC family protein [unclassified Neptuniibacter]MDO6514131.1 SoxR reducing system RseC family protein [Neptuniibacter sp. 2_MG-2023]MDO6592746.1 SoxR reducing system RseC family protein [Neptuniibacter sp. 1_MG-2023]